MEGPANNLIVDGKQAHTPERKPEDYHIVAALIESTMARRPTDIYGLAAILAKDENRTMIVHVLETFPDLLAALQNLVADVCEYERINNLAPNPGKQDCWQSITQARAAIAKAIGSTP